MSKRNANAFITEAELRRRRWQVIRGLIGVAAVVLAAVIVWALLVPGTDWLARHDIGSAKSLFGNPVGSDDTRVLSMADHTS
jgi:hypothetical protein